MGDKKIASLGIGVKRWVTYHGVAINLNNDPQAFKGISPCGFNTDVMTSLEQIIGERVDRQQFIHQFVQNFN
ncbi:MAG: hypothetical protein R2827_11525 [Bdellovibrionales bacterium]